MAIWHLWTYITAVVSVAFCDSGTDVSTETEDEKD